MFFNLHILVLVSSSNIGPSRQGQFGVIKDEHIAVKSCSSLEEGSFIHDPCFNDSWIYDLVIDPPLAANTVCRYILDNNIHITSLIYFFAGCRRSISCRKQRKSFVYILCFLLFWRDSCIIKSLFITEKGLFAYLNDLFCCVNKV